MAVVLNEESVLAQPFGVRASRKRLITTSNIPETNILLDRWTLDPGGDVDVNLSSTSVAWFHLLEGESTIQWSGSKDRLDNAHAVFLAPGSRARMTTATGAHVLYVEVPHAARFGVEEASGAPRSRIIDWKREPLLDSKHDSRKRIYMATPKLIGTRAMKCEIDHLSPLHLRLQAPARGRRTLQVRGGRHRNGICG